MNVLKLMHPSSRRLERVKEHRLSDGAYKGFVVAPWDCVCERVCACHKRPKTPPPGREGEAFDDLQERVAALAEAGIIRKVQVKRGAGAGPTETEDD